MENDNERCSLSIEIKQKKGDGDDIETSEGGEGAGTIEDGTPPKPKNKENPKTMIFQNLEQSSFFQNFIKIKKAKERG